MGTPEFSVPSLKKLVNSGYKPTLCITQPDRPQGRRKKITPPPVKTAAESLNIKVIQPEDVNDDPTIEILQKIKPQIIITAAYGGYLKRTIRKLPVLGCLNLHPSLLPKYRGSSPINQALFNNDKITGCTIFKIVAKMDAGPIIYQSRMDISENDCFTSLSNKLSKQGAEDLIQSLQILEKNDFSFISQSSENATLCKKIEKIDLLLDWNWKTEKIIGRIRGFAEKPGITASFRGKRIKVIEAVTTNEKPNYDPGYIYKIEKNIGIFISGIDNNILIKKLQPSGKKIMDSFAFHLGARIKIGEFFQNGS